MKHYSQISFVICALATLLTSLHTMLIVCSILAVSRRQNGLSLTSILPQILIQDTAAIVAEIASLRNEKAAKIRQLLQE
jgi:hypothetical protein